MGRALWGLQFDVVGCGTRARRCPRRKQVGRGTEARGRARERLAIGARPKAVGPLATPSGVLHGLQDEGQCPYTVQISRQYYRWVVLSLSQVEVYTHTVSKCRYRSLTVDEKAIAYRSPYIQ